MLERIARSYQTIQDNVAQEDVALVNCNATIIRVENLQKKTENNIGKVSLNYYDVCFSQ